MSGADTIQIGATPADWHIPVMSPIPEKLGPTGIRQLTGSPLQVVGASAAGLFAGLLLVREGVPVDVLETSTHLDPLPRTLIVTNKFRHLLGSLSQPCIVNEVSRFELFTDGRCATVHLEKPDLVIERSSLIRSLAEAASAGWRPIPLWPPVQGIVRGGQSA